MTTKIQRNMFENLWMRFSLFKFMILTIKVAIRIARLVFAFMISHGRDSNRAIGVRVHDFSQ